jgi:hypothetical protein
MNNDLLFFTELDDAKVEQLLKYTSYGSKSLDNIKSRVQQKKSLTRKRVHKRILLAAAALLLGTGTALAATANLDRVYQTIFGGQAEYMRNQGYNMGLVAEAEGVEVELISASLYGQEMTMILSIRDTAGSRIDEATQFARTTARSKNGDLDCFTAMFDFDSETGEQIRVETVSIPRDVETDEITYTLEFLHGGFVYRSGVIQIDLHDTVSNHFPSSFQENPEYPKRLAPDETHIAFSDIGWDWSYISNIGFVDGRLHIQVKDDTWKAPYSHYPARGYIYLALIGSDGKQYVHYDNDDERVVEEYSFRSGGNTYREYVFTNIADIGQLKDMELAYAGLFEATEIIDAEWSLAFKLPSESESLVIPVKRSLPVTAGKELFADSIVLTPLSVSMTFPVDDANDFEQRHPDYFDGLAGKQFLTYEDGTTLEFRFNTWRNWFLHPGSAQKQEARVSYYRPNRAWSVIEIGKVKSVTIQGVEFIVEK